MVFAIEAPPRECLTARGSAAAQWEAIWGHKVMLQITMNVNSIYCTYNKFRINLYHQVIAIWFYSNGNDTFLEVPP